MQSDGLHLKMRGSEKVRRVFHSLFADICGERFADFFSEHRGEIPRADAEHFGDLRRRKFFGKPCADEDGGVFYDMRTDARQIFSDKAAVGGENVSHQFAPFGKIRKMLDLACNIRGHAVNNNRVNTAFFGGFSEKGVHNDGIVFCISETVGNAFFKLFLGKKREKLLFFVELPLPHGFDQFVFESIPPFHRLHIERGVVFCAVTRKPKRRIVATLVFNGEGRTFKNPFAEGVKQGVDGTFFGKNRKRSVVFVKETLALRRNGVPFTDFENFFGGQSVGKKRPDQKQCLRLPSRDEKIAEALPEAVFDAVDGLFRKPEKKAAYAVFFG